MTRVVAVDTESTGLHPYHEDRCTVVSFADEAAAWSADARADNRAAGRQVRRLVNDADVTFVMHNSPYDRAVLWTAFGVEIADDRIWDTQTVDWLMGEAEDHRLKEGPGTRLFGIDAGEEKRHLTALKRGRTVQDVYRELRAEVNQLPKAERERATATRERAKSIAEASHKDWGGPNPFSYADLKDYAEKDARLTYDIQAWQQSALTEEYAYVAPAIAREQQVAGLAYRMTQRGVKVDAGRAEQELAAAETRAAELAREFEAYNLEAPAQVARMLYDDWGLTCSRHTDAGARSTDKYALERLTYDPRVLRLIEYRELSQALKLFYRPLLDKIGTDGRVHPSWNPHRTVSGRWSCSDPNLMQLPKYDPDKPPTALAGVKACFVPEPGYALVSADLPNAELRIAAILCDVEMWLRAFREGRDLHQDTADAMGLARHPAKTCNYQLLYGSGPSNLALHLARGTGQAPRLAYGKEVYDQYWSAVPEVRRVMKLLEKCWVRDGRLPISGYPGRFRHLDSSRGREPAYKALNAEIQPQVAEMVKSWTLELERAAQGIDSRLIVQVHDAATLEVPLGREAEAKRLMQETLDAVNPFTQLDWTLDYKLGV